MAKVKTTTGAALKGVPGNIKSPWKMPKKAAHPKPTPKRSK